MQESLTPAFIDELIHRGFESDNLDYKETFDDSTGAWMEVAKDIYALSNFGGGYIVLGVQDGTFKPVGLVLGQGHLMNPSGPATYRCQVLFPHLRITGFVGHY